MLRIGGKTLRQRLAYRLRQLLLRPLAPEALLGRDEIDPDPDLLNTAVRGRTIVVTGAGGSIGKEICRQLLNLGPLRIILLDLSEAALFSIHDELKFSCTGLADPPDIVPVLGSVGNARTLGRVFHQFDVDAVFHAAAYKHVGMIEDNLLAGVENNLLGTLELTKAAICAAVPDFVLVSTDKAVDPKSVMGKTKRAAEVVCTELCKTTPTRATIVRFGNVLGSSGSVLPRVLGQIERGGPVLLTDPSARRVFMSSREAALLVIQACGLGGRGGTFALKVGNPLRISDLLQSILTHRFRMYWLAKLFGLIPRIQIVGPGQAEKQIEADLVPRNAIATCHPFIWEVGQSDDSDTSACDMIGLLEKAVATGSETAAMEVLAAMLEAEYAKDGSSPSTMQLTAFSTGRSAAHAAASGPMVDMLRPPIFLPPEPRNDGRMIGH